MALANYTDLQASVLAWSERADLSVVVADCIALAEAKLNRLLGAVETDTTLTGVAGSRAISISTLSIVQPIALFLAEASTDERLLTPKADGTFEYLTSPGRPALWAIDGTNIDFDRPLDAAYPFRFRYRQRFALSVSPTNWLLTNHPDIYLAATMMWGLGYKEDWQNGAIWKGVLEEGIPEVKNIIAQSKRAVLTVDPGLQRRTRRSYADLVNNG